MFIIIIIIIIIMIIIIIISIRKKYKRWKTIDITIRTNCRKKPSVKHGR